MLPCSPRSTCSTCSRAPHALHAPHAHHAPHVPVLPKYISNYAGRIFIESFSTLKAYHVVFSAKKVLTCNIKNKRMLFIILHKCKEGVAGFAICLMKTKTRRYRRRCAQKKQTSSQCEGSVLRSKGYQTTAFRLCASSNLKNRSEESQDLLPNLQFSYLLTKSA